MFILWFWGWFNLICTYIQLCVYTHVCVCLLINNHIVFENWLATCVLGRPARQNGSHECCLVACFSQVMGSNVGMVVDLGSVFLNYFFIFFIVNCPLVCYVDVLNKTWVCFNFKWWFFLNIRTIQVFACLVFIFVTKTFCIITTVVILL